jgi:hypothetical protein
MHFSLGLAVFTAWVLLQLHVARVLIVVPPVAALPVG